MHELGHIGIYQVRKLFESCDKGSANKRPPIRIPGIKYLWGICSSANRRLFGILLVIAIPDGRINNFYQRMAL